jgi:hypothetical protein
MSQDQIKTIRELKERYPYQFVETYWLELTYGWFYVFVQLCKPGSMDSTGGYMLTLCPDHGAARQVDPRALKIWFEDDNEVVEGSSNDECN